jgi:hypothetical protein
VKMLAEYLENAIKFEQLAARERDVELRANFEKLAAAYRKLAERRAQESALAAPQRAKLAG